MSSKKSSINTEVLFDGEVLVVLYINSGIISQMWLPLQSDVSPAQRKSPLAKGVHKQKGKENRCVRQSCSNWQILALCLCVGSKTDLKDSLFALSCIIESLSNWKGININPFLWHGAP